MMAPVLWVLAVLSTITVIHRIWYTYLMAKGMRLPGRRRGHPAGGVDPQPGGIRPGV